MLEPSHYNSDKAYLPVTITSGATVSEAVHLHGMSLCGIIIPSTYDGATLTLQMSDSLNGTYIPVADGTGNIFTMNVTAGRYHPITDLPVIAGLMFIRLVAGSVQASTNTLLKLAVRKI